MRLLGLTPLLLGACGVGLDQYAPDAVTDTGDAEVPQAFGALTLSRTAIDFGELALGAERSESLLLTNDGEEQINLLSVDLVDGGPFRITTTLVGDIAPGGEQVLELAFSPTQTGSFSDALVIETDAPGAERVEVRLNGSGAGEDPGDDSGAPTASLGFSPRSFSFGTVDIGDVGALPFTITNEGEADLTITNIVGSPAVFAWDRSFNLPYVLRPGESRAGNITFTPTSEGAASGSITVSTNDPQTPQLSLSTSGVGNQGCTICAPILLAVDSSYAVYRSEELTLNFGNFVLSSSVSLQNDGDEDLLISGVTVHNDWNVWPGPCSFTASGWGNGLVTLTPGQSRSLTVTYNCNQTSLDTPDVSGRANIIEVASNASATPFIILLSGGYVAN